MSVASTWKTIPVWGTMSSLPYKCTCCLFNLKQSSWKWLAPSSATEQTRSVYQKFDWGCCTLIKKVFLYPFEQRINTNKWPFDLCAHVCMCTCLLILMCHTSHLPTNNALLKISSIFQEGAMCGYKWLNFHSQEICRLSPADTHLEKSAWSWKLCEPNSE